MKLDWNNPDWQKAVQLDHLENLPVASRTAAECTLIEQLRAHFYCPEHRYNPAPAAGFNFCPRCEA